MADGLPACRRTACHLPAPAILTHPQRLPYYLLPGLCLFITQTPRVAILPASACAHASFICLSRMHCLRYHICLLARRIRPRTPHRVCGAACRPHDAGARILLPLHISSPAAHPWPPLTLNRAFGISPAAATTAVWRACAARHGIYLGEARRGGGEHLISRALKNSGGISGRCDDGDAWRNIGESEKRHGVACALSLSWRRSVAGKASCAGGINQAARQRLAAAQCGEHRACLPQRRSPRALARHIAHAPIGRWCAYQTSLSFLSRRLSRISLFECAITCLAHRTRAGIA